MDQIADGALGDDNGEAARLNWSIVDLRSASSD
jgi:hypothetical protein